MPDNDSQWWYCLKHREPEQGRGCAHAERLGPYPTRQEAEQAIQAAAARSEAWEDDPRWNDERR